MGCGIMFPRDYILDSEGEWDEGGQPGWLGRRWGQKMGAVPQGLRFPGLLGDSDDSCDTVILSPTARAVRNVRNVMYLHQEGEEEEEEEEEEEDGEEIEQEHEGKKVVVSVEGLGLD